MTIRVIGGEYGGRRLVTPPGRGTRPTADRVREAWFSALAQELVGASVIDLFSGSGALGIEALSRGARHATFVEKDARALATLRRNLRSLGLEERASVIGGDVFATLSGIDPSRTAFDIALADPPYRVGLARRLVEVWLERPFAGMLCIEHGRAELDEMASDWTRAYGDTELSFFIRAGRTE